MTENTNNNPGTEKPPDKNAKPRFNTNWIFAILAVSVILFQYFYGGKAVQKTTTSEVKAMIANRDVEKITVVNKDYAEIYLKKQALESGRYPKLPKPGTGFAMSVPKANFTYNIGDISNFEPFILEAQKSAGFTDNELIYPDYITKKNYLVDILSWLLFPALLVILWLFLMKRMSGGGAGGRKSVV